MVNAPYTGPAFGADKFWRTGVAEVNPAALRSIYRKRFAISPVDRIATAGSCFAQHIATYLARNGFNVLDVEPPPTGLPPSEARRFRYSTFSARYGNIYAARHLLQLAQEAFGRFAPGEAVWERDGRYFDALRPTVEPDGLDSPDEVRAHRKFHLAAVRRLLEQCDIFIFTFGLTECWMHRATGTVYPLAPGVNAGRYDPATHAFHNMTVGEVIGDFLAFRELVMSVNPACRFIVTVSPVPLTATASEQHVLVATTYSKSVLRAAAGEIHRQCENVDYFPSYEIVTNVAARGAFFEPNFRTVQRAGVESAMTAFFAEHKNAVAPMAKGPRPEADEDRDAACEDAFLDAFAPGGGA